MSFTCANPWKTAAQPKPGDNTLHTRMKNLRRREIAGRIRRAPVWMHPLRLAVAVVLVCPAGFAPRAVCGAQPAAERRALSGRVVADNGLPIGGATVTLRLPSASGSRAFWGAVVVSDARGYFSVPEAEDGTYVATVEASGFAPQSKLYALDESASPLEIVIERLASLALRVMEPNGAPLANGAVSLLLRGASGGSQRLERARTNGGGIALLTGLVPSRYTLHAVAARRGYADLSDVNLAPGAQTDVEVRLQQGGVLRVTAREPAAAPGGEERPLGGAVLSLSAVPGGGAPAESFAAGTLGQKEPQPSTRDGDGVVELHDLPPGRYSASLTLYGYTPPEAQTVDVRAGATSSLSLMLKPLVADAQAPLQVLAQDAKGQPIADREFIVRLTKLSGGEGPGAVRSIAPRRARSGADGRFMVYPLPPGHWRITLGLPRRADAELDDLQGRPPLPGDYRAMLSSAPQTVQVTDAGGAVTIAVPLRRESGG